MLTELPNGGWLDPDNVNALIPMEPGGSRDRYGVAVFTYTGDTHVIDFASAQAALVWIKHFATMCNVMMERKRQQQEGFPVPERPRKGFVD